MVLSSVVVVRMCHWKELNIFILPVWVCLFADRQTWSNEQISFQLSESNSWMSSFIFFKFGINPVHNDCHSQLILKKHKNESKWPVFLQILCGPSRGWSSTNILSKKSMSKMLPSTYWRSLHNTTLSVSNMFLSAQNVLKLSGNTYWGVLIWYQYQICQILTKKMSVILQPASNIFDIFRTQIQAVHSKSLLQNLYPTPLDSA